MARAAQTGLLLVRSPGCARGVGSSCACNASLRWRLPRGRAPCCSVWGVRLEGGAYAKKPLASPEEDQRATIQRGYQRCTR